MKITLGLLAAALVVVLLLGGCTTFGRISWRNALIVFRTPDAVPHKLISPRRDDARLCAIWVGHATVLVQMDDKFILTDPVLTRYVGGVSPRLVEPGLDASHLPRVEVVLISHRHYDHLSRPTFRLIESKISDVITPPGAGKDVPPGAYRVTDIPLWQSWEKEGLRVTAVPARHVGGRNVGDNRSHPHAFTGWIIEYRGQVVFFAGDTAYDEEMFESIALKFPRVDLALMPIRPLAPAAEMAPHHMNGAQALEAGRLLRAKHLLPIHYGTFINSLDPIGAEAADFEQALANRPEGGPQAALLPIGGQRVFQ